MNALMLKSAVADGRFDKMFTTLYGAEHIAAQRQRYTKVIDEFTALFGGEREISLFSVAGRSEISGNHTDHNCGRVLAASIDLDIIAAASPLEVDYFGYVQRIFEIRSQGRRLRRVHDVKRIQRLGTLVVRGV